MRKILKFGPSGNDLLQEDDDAARFADAGGAKHREMPADQIVDVDMHADLGILLQIADMGAVVVDAAVDHAQFLLGHQDRAVADPRIIVDAALKLHRIAGPGADLAQEFEAGNALPGASGVGA